MPPPPLAIISRIPSSLQQNHQNNHQQQLHQIVELSEIPPPRDLDLLSIPKPSSLRLEEIRIPMPPEGSKIKIPKSKVELTELVAANGDGYEEILVTKCNKDDFDPQLK